MTPTTTMYIIQHAHATFKNPLIFIESLTQNFSSHSIQSFMASSAARNRWIRPEVYPLFASMAVALGICGMQLVRNITTNPEVRVNKENRAAGILDNHAEGEKYSQHALRKFVRNKAPEIMPSINGFFSDPKY